MASKFTKDMPHANIATLFRGWVRVATTDATSTASNSLRKKTSFQTERRACFELEKRGWTILGHDVHVAHVQVDILARDPSGLLSIIEVKSQSRMAHLSRSQRTRLLRACSVLAEFERVQLVLALMSLRDLVLLPVDGLTV
jgi:Holliday junction resolvase-like predicted endonuclease